MGISCDILSLSRGRHLRSLHCLNTSCLKFNSSLTEVYSGVCVQQLVKSFEVCDLPVRAAKFVARKNWVITGSVSRETVSAFFVLFPLQCLYWIHLSEFHIHQHDALIITCILLSSWFIVY